MNKKKIIEFHNSKIKLLKKHNNLYYNKDAPKITDAEYDKLKKEILDLENKYQFLKENNSIDLIIGSKPLNKFKKVKHLSPMLSLSNAFNRDDMNDFLKKIKNFLNSPLTFALTLFIAITGLGCIAFSSTYNSSNYNNPSISTY